MKIFLPYRGEFGWICMMHAPQVYACDEPKIVACEWGNEALYPDAECHYDVPRRNDDNRRAAIEKGWLDDIEKTMRKQFGPLHEYVRPDHDAPREYFVPEAYYKYTIHCDVVICPRKRNYGSDKNWPHWDQLLHELVDDCKLQVFAAGAPDSSEDLVCPRAWRYRRYLDASIQAIKSAKLVIATDCGLAHLAMMCGTPLLLLTHANGLVAPGTDDVGRPYWPVKIGRFQDANHCNVHITTAYGTWDDPGVVMGFVKELLCG